MFVNGADDQVGEKAILVYVYRTAETFEGENFHECRGFVSVHESFLRENRQPHTHLIGGAKQSTKVFFASFLFSTNS